MKKVIVFLTALTLMFSVAGCGKEVVVNEYGEETPVYGDLIEISHRDYDITRRESLVYDKNTKVMYWYFYNIYNIWDGCVSVSPYYIVDKNGKPEIGVYKKNYEP